MYLEPLIGSSCYSANATDISGEFVICSLLFPMLYHVSLDSTDMGGGGVQSRQTKGWVGGIEYTMSSLGV